MTEQVNDPYRDLLIKWRDELHRQDDEITRLRAQRDQLLAALEQIIERYETAEDGWPAEDMREIARAAVEKKP